MNNAPPNSQIPVPDPLAATDRARLHGIAAWCLGAFPFVTFILAWLHGTDVSLTVSLSAAISAFPFLIRRRCSTSTASIVFGSVVAANVCILIHAALGPYQPLVATWLYLAIVAMAIFGDARVIGAAVSTAFLHHVFFYWGFPAYAQLFFGDGFSLQIMLLLSAGLLGFFQVQHTSLLVATAEERASERTEPLKEANRTLRAILDSVDDGFLKIDAQGILREERSAAVERMFGSIQPGDSLVEVLSRHDPKLAHWLAVGLVEVFAGMLPSSVTIGQLPDRITVKGRCLSLNYFPVETNNALTGLTVVVTDITAEVEREKIQAESRELLVMFERLKDDRSGFLEFFQEASDIVADLRRSTEEVTLVKRQLHTLKGNAAIFELDRLSTTCHELEELIGEAGEVPDGRAWTKLLSCWASTRNNLQQLVKTDEREYQLSEEQYMELLEGILGGEPTEDVACKLARWKLDPTKPRLRRIATEARRLAKKQGKGEIKVFCHSNHLRLESPVWRNFWQALIHVVRNAVDHGLEPIEERRLAKKSETGTLHLSTVYDDDRFIVSVKDDGRGIDWQAVAEAASARGLPQATPEDLIESLFADGLTTCKKATELSGRGVGMAAIKQVCDQLGGTIDVVSEPEQGTEFRFTFPAEAMAPDTHMLLELYGIEFHFRSVIAASY